MDEARPIGSEQARVPVMPIFQVGLLPADLIIALGDLAIIHAWLSGKISSIAAVGVHIAFTFTLVGLAALVRRTLTARLVCRLFTLLLLGPLGGAAVLVQRGTQLVRRDGSSAPKKALVEKAKPRLLRPGRAEAICAAIRQGRRPRPAVSRLKGFAEIFAGDDLTAQQAAIAAISRRYRPDMLPALMTALDARIPAIRVQAAAVYARLRGEFADQAKALLAAKPDLSEGGEAVAALARECRSVARSGFLDRSIVELLEAAAEALERDLARHRLGARQPRACREGLVVEAMERFSTRPATRDAPLLNAPPALNGRTCGGMA
jgi:hypothetical protein